MGKPFAPDSLLSGSDDFENRNELYRKRRDDFRDNPAALAELVQWKAQNNAYTYKILTGFVPPSLIGKPFGKKSFSKTDTFFSEYEAHNDASLILSRTADSLIIGNLASYDQRQYPTWFNETYQPGINTPEGQAFGHTLIISRKRIYNIVDPDATTDLLREMIEHFTALWSTDAGKSKLLQRVRDAVDAQNAKLAAKPETIDRYRDLLPQIQDGFESASLLFLNLTVRDFVFAVHAWPDSTVGHLHVHVFPPMPALRNFSAKRHDPKTISLDCVFAVEEEDSSA